MLNKFFWIKRGKNIAASIVGWSIFGIYGIFFWIHFSLQKTRIQTRMKFFFCFSTLTIWLVTVKFQSCCHIIHCSRTSDNCHRKFDIDKNFSFFFYYFVWWSLMMIIDTNNNNRLYHHNAVDEHSQLSNYHINIIIILVNDFYHFPKKKFYNRNFENLHMTNYSINHLFFGCNENQV